MEFKEKKLGYTIAILSIFTAFIMITEWKKYEVKVIKIMDFGVFVNFFGKRDGLVHVSQLASERVNHPKDMIKDGQEVKVKLLGFDDRGKVRLSMKVVDQNTGLEIKNDKF